jgi:hypothetical protein
MIPTVMDESGDLFHLAKKHHRHTARPSKHIAIAVTNLTLDL